STDVEELQAKGVPIWDEDAQRNGGDLGPVYGFQFKHFFVTYTNSKAAYTSQGIDQIKALIHKLKTDRNDRRLILCAWNVADLDKMAVPPCHVLCQFYVHEDKYLSCEMYQRSCDVGIVIPFNLGSYGLLTCMLAYHCGLQPYEFIHILGNAHVYENHKEELLKQLDR